jgi:hypothetical protein
VGLPNIASVSGQVRPRLIRGLAVTAAPRDGGAPARTANNDPDEKYGPS